MKKRLIITILIIIFLIIALILALIAIQKRTNLQGKAYSTNEISSNYVELSNSYLFASPLTALVNGEKIRVNVFILDSQGRGVSGKNVTLGQSEKLKVDLIQPNTDDIGRAIFDLSADSPGLYVIEAKVDGRTLPQRVTITFR